ncbi:MAG: guanylate kinase [Actinobacteria bacterium]|nr:guanylate kinase [Actinomycetota bacterium]
MANRVGNVFIVSGPSGAGKGTLVQALKDRVPDLWVSVSATTRTPRVGELDGVSYIFLSPEEFLQRKEAGEFLEWACVHGNYYGTPRGLIDEKVAEGKQVILEIDPQGALQVKKAMPDSVLIFIKTPSMEELESRLNTRGTESPEQIKVRIRTAILEMELAETYDFVVTNDDVNRATEAIVRIIDEHAETP